MTVAVVGVIVFGVLFAVNWMVCRSVVYPGVALAGIWLLEFIVQAFAQGVLYPVSWYALAVFVVGAVCFTAGAALVYRCGARPGNPTKSSAAQAQAQAQRGDGALLWFLVALLVGGLPTFIEKVRQFTSAALFSPAFFVQARQGFLEQAAAMSRAPVVDNLVVLSSIFALIGYALTDGARRQRVAAWALIGLSLVYNLLTAAKAGAVTLVVALFAIHVLLRRRLAMRFLITSFGGILVLFGVVTVGRLETVGQSLTLAQSAVATWHYFLGYFSASPVGFSTYLDHPDLVPAVWSPWQFFERTANYFRHFFHVPDLNAHFVRVGPDMFYNTYTAYFSYYPAYGLAGVIGFMSTLGMLCTWVYRRALSLGLVWLVLYGMLLYGILMTIFSESLLLSLNFILKLVVVALLVAGFRRLRWRAHASRVVMPDAIH